MAAANEVSFRGQLSAESRVIRKEAGIDFQDDYETLSIVIEKNDGLSPHKKWLKCMREQKGGHRKQGPPVHVIRKVPDMVRQKELGKGCFDPLVVSIGPYHHGKSELEEVERLKTPMALQSVHRSGESFDCIYKKVENISANGRKCYPRDSTNQFDEKEFTQMMFLDGCFILQFIDSLDNQGIQSMKSNIVAYVRRDLFLLENQLPYKVLKLLMRLRFKDRRGDELINRFIHSICGSFRQESFIEKLFARCYSQFRAHLKVKKGNQGQTSHSERNKEEDECRPIHLLELFQMQFIDKSALSGSSNTKNWGRYSYPAAKELRTLGIHFRPSRGDRFTDIKYIETFSAGILFLPKLIIDDTTKPLLLNLVAYEACPEGPDDCGITSYICFMDSLIDQAEDVKQLRSDRIIFNLLGSDQQAADLFNEIAKDLVPNPEAFAVVKDSIEQHSKSIWRTWMAEWLHDHFSSPWTFFAFLAATIALLLTVLQTYLSLIDSCSSRGKQKHDFLCVFF